MRGIPITSAEMVKLAVVEGEITQASSNDGSKRNKKSKGKTKIMQIKKFQEDKIYNCGG